MASIAFDTHAFVKELTSAGMPEAQAEVLAKSQAKLIDEKLATKHDLKELEERLRRDMKRARATAQTRFDDTARLNDGHCRRRAVAAIGEAPLTRKHRTSEISRLR